MIIGPTAGGTCRYCYGSRQYVAASPSRARRTDGQPDSTAVVNWAICKFAQRFASQTFAQNGGVKLCVVGYWRKSQRFNAMIRRAAAAGGEMVRRR